MINKYLPLAEPVFCSSPVVMLSVETRQGRVRAPSHTPVVCNVETILVADTVRVVSTGSGPGAQCRQTEVRLPGAGARLEVGVEPASAQPPGPPHGEAGNTEVKYYPYHYPDNFISPKKQ